MFNMYKNTYESAGQKLWFTSVEELFRYTCSYIILTKTINNISYIQCYIMFQKRNRSNKISLLCHDGSKTAKTELMSLVNTLLNIKGWVLEASDATSWVLRSRHNTPVISDIKQIYKILDIDTSTEKIVMNSDFDYSEKNSYQYIHQYYSNGIVAFENKETLFGISGCQFNNKSCSRKCVK